MLFPRLISVFRLTVQRLAVVLLATTTPTALFAQQTAPASSTQPASLAAPQPAQPQAVHLRDYSVPRSAFPHLLQPYMAQELAQPNLGNSPRIDGLLRDGKIYLSIDDAIARPREQSRHRHCPL